MAIAELERVKRVRDDTGEVEKGQVTLDAVVCPTGSPYNIASRRLN